MILRGQNCVNFASTSGTVSGLRNESAAAPTIAPNAAVTFGSSVKSPAYREGDRKGDEKEGRMHTE